MSLMLPLFRSKVGLAGGEVLASLDLVLVFTHVLPDLSIAKVLWVHPLRPMNVSILAGYRFIPDKVAHVC